MVTPNPDQATPERVSIAGWIGRAIAMVIFVPPRLVWEGLKLLGRMVRAALRYFVEELLAPAAKLSWYWVIRPVWTFVKNYLWGLLIQQLLWGAVLTPLGAFLLDFLLRPLKKAVEEWVWRRLLLPALRGLAWVFVQIAKGLAFLGYWLIVVPMVWLWRKVLRPALEALAVAFEFLGRWVIAWPLRMLWRWVLRPLLLALIAIVVFGWQVATTVVNFLVVTPCRWLYRTVAHPLLRLLAVVWAACVTRPIRWVHQRIVTPLNKWAAEIMASVFGN
ncbi:hypothetical protein LTV02_14065 [Nocardia yamanashiensis]|uniref:hypothetical protein n=1 Tax=Nocardia yamanashiensis TaxID=209247 RepID=UPI001E4D263E|nr:hypothetical protein [Nocardia yamanashiensis]UGT44444.1 hypothetical protein LTV02_14065 [Nocardia yamanashiensis]